MLIKIEDLGTKINSSSHLIKYMTEKQMHAYMKICLIAEWTLELDEEMTNCSIKISGKFCYLHWRKEYVFYNRRIFQKKKTHINTFMKEI